MRENMYVHNIPPDFPRNLDNILPSDIIYLEGAFGLPFFSPVYEILNGIL